MGRLCAAIVLMVSGVAHADAPVKIAAVPDGPIRLTVGEEEDKLTRAFRLLPQGVEQVKVDKVRVADCADARGTPCTAEVRGGCADGCTLTTTEPGAVTVVVPLAKAGTYTASLEIVYIKEEKQLPDNKVQVVKAVLATALEVTRPAPAAPAVQAMKVTVSGPTGTEVDRWPLRKGTAKLRLHLQDDDGAERTIAQVVPAPLVRKSGSDSLACTAEVHVRRADGSDLAGGSLKLAASGGDVDVEVSGLEEPGKYEGKLRLLAPGRTPQEIAYTVTARDGILIASLVIAFGVVVSYGVQWWVGRRRARLVQQKALERLRERLHELQARDPLADRDRRLLDALLDEVEGKLTVVEDGTALAADALERLARRVALADALIKTGQDVERLPLAARGEPRKQLDANAILLADAVDDAKLKDIESALRTIAGTGVRRAALRDLLAALDAAVKQAEGALPAGLQSRLTTEVGTALSAAHAAADNDKLDDLDRALERGRGALARVQGAALAERLPETAPTAFDDPAAYKALRADVTGRLAALDAAPDADSAVRLYQETLARVAAASCAAAARWCRAQAGGKPAEIQNQLRALAAEAEAARDKPPGDALAIVDRVMRDAEGLARGPEDRETGASDGSDEPEPLAAIPQLAAITRRPRIRTRALLAFGDGVVFVALTLIAVGTGLKLLWAGNATWGGWNDWLTAMLWGAGLHAVGNDTFKGLLGLQKTLGKVE